MLKLLPLGEQIKTANIPYLIQIAKVIHIAKDMLRCHPGFIIVSELPHLLEYKMRISPPVNMARGKPPHLIFVYDAE